MSCFLVSLVEAFDALVDAKLTIRTVHDVHVWLGLRVNRTGPPDLPMKRHEGGNLGGRDSFGIELVEHVSDHL